MAVGQPGALSLNGTLVAGRVTAIDDTKVILENQPPQLFPQHRQHRCGVFHRHVLPPTRCPAIP